MAIEELLQIPDVGTKIAEDLWNLGIRYVISNNQDPEVLYSRLQAREGVHVDRCVLYIFPCGLLRSTMNHNPELLKWWNWKDERR